MDKKVLLENGTELSADFEGEDEDAKWTLIAGTDGNSKTVDEPFRCEVSGKAQERVSGTFNTNFWYISGEYKVLERINNLRRHCCGRDCSAFDIGGGIYLPHSSETGEPIFGSPYDRNQGTDENPVKICLSDYTCEDFGGDSRREFESGVCSGYSLDSKVGCSQSGPAFYAVGGIVRQQLYGRKCQEPEVEDRCEGVEEELKLFINGVDASTLTEYQKTYKAGDLFEISVSGGKGPYEWKISSYDWSGDVVDDSVVNFKWKGGVAPVKIPEDCVFSDCKGVIIKAKDQCNNSVEETMFYALPCEGWNGNIIENGNKEARRCYCWDPGKLGLVQDILSTEEIKEMYRQASSNYIIPLITTMKERGNHPICDALEKQEIQERECDNEKMSDWSPKTINPTDLNCDCIQIDGNKKRELSSIKENFKNFSEMQEFFRKRYRLSEEDFEKKKSDFNSYVNAKVPGVPSWTSFSLICFLSETGPGRDLVNKVNSNYSTTIDENGPLTKDFFEKIANLEGSELEVIEEAYQEIANGTGSYYDFFEINCLYPRTSEELLKTKLGVCREFVILLNEALQRRGIKSTLRAKNGHIWLNITLTEYPYQDISFSLDPTSFSEFLLLEPQAIPYGHVHCGDH